jgi:4Fe-4S single cluster domain
MEGMADESRGGPDEVLRARSVLGTDPELFQVDDIGYALRPEFDVPPGAEENAREGAAACPERAITLH